jgi:hypothetical protein
MASASIVTLMVAFIREVGGAILNNQIGAISFFFLRTEEKPDLFCYNKGETMICSSSPPPAEEQLGTSHAKLFLSLHSPLDYNTNLVNFFFQLSQAARNSTNLVIACFL